jgi:phenylalanyl-tRNA synthetase alpha chain
VGKLKNGQKCKLCKSGWLEVAGAGMVHPNVLKYGGLDPQKYTGFAFGMGVERALTLKPGLQLDDIRPFYQNNLEFLSQF